MTLIAVDDDYPYLKYVKEIETEFIKQMEKEFQLSCSATGGSMPKNVESIYVSFTAFREGTLNEARKIEVLGTEKLLKLMNNHEKIRPYLSHYPMTHEGADVTIAFLKESYDFFSNGSIALVTHGKGKLHYSVNDPKLDNFVKLKEETFEEAYEIIKQQNLLP
jgi:hypothetical protein